MKKYNINKMLEAWSSLSSISSADPFPAAETDVDPGEVMDTKSDNFETNTDANDPYEVNKYPLQVAEAAPPEEEPPVDPSMQDPSMDPSMQDPSMAGGAPMDPSMAGGAPGMPPMPGPTSDFEVGRIYELKKIYSRLVSMQSYLSGTTDPNLIKLTNYVSNSMDLFRTLISNIALYKDRLDEIIITFYKVVNNVYQILSKYYKDKNTGRMVQAIENTVYKKTGKVFQTNEGRISDFASLKYSEIKHKNSLKKFSNSINDPDRSNKPCSKGPSPECEKWKKENNYPKGNEQNLLDVGRRNEDLYNATKHNYDKKYKS